MSSWALFFALMVFKALTASAFVQARTALTRVKQLYPTVDTICKSLPDPQQLIDEEVDPGEIGGYSIVKYPHPALRSEAVEVTEFNDELKDLSKAMFKLMYAAQGVGLAAPQVGVCKRVMVFNPDGDRAKWLSEVTLVNPVITAKSEKTDVENEGCLSFPGIRGEVTRNKWVKVEALSLKGKKIKKKYEGWEARIFQHEFDHLERTVFIDRLGEEDRAVAQPILDTLAEAYGPGGAL